LRVLGSYGKSFRAPLISAISTPAGGDLFFANDPRFPGGTGVALYQSGGNEDLRPEKSKSWTATINYAPENVRGLSLSGTYFSYDFRDKILAPVPDRSFPLDEPSIAPFAVIFPTMEQVQAVANSLLPPILNNADPDSTLDDVLAILDNRFVNVSTWTAHGVDLLGDYRIEVPNGMLNVSFNASKLFVKARPAPTAALTTLSGVVFGPPELKIRTGLGWSAGSLNAAGFVNYLDGATDIYSVPSRKLSSFITVDLNIGYAFPQSPGVLSGLRVDLAALNALDRSPPELSPASTTYPGIGYDSTNMSPLGRVLTLRLSKDWLQR
jgi:outer membrane receptor protein involved in Fe transport